MESIEKHIEKDEEILANPTTSPQQRRHIEGELHELEDYAEHHKKEIEASLHRIVNKLLHPPLESLKDESEAGSAGLLDAPKRLFQLGD